MARYLITGGGGFIGSNLVEALLRNGDFVRVLDNFSTGRRSNLLPFQNDIELIEGDIRSYHIVQKAVQGMDFVLHQAALGSVPRSIHDPLTTHEVNTTGTLNLLHASVDARVKRFVMASSSSIYGDNPTSPKVETLTPMPKSPYAVSKLTGEHYCRVFHQIYGLETVVLRYFNVFGPRQDPGSQYAAVIPKFIKAMMEGQAPVIFGDGSTSRDFTYVANNVQANLLACDAPNVGGKTFNIACGTTYSLLDLVNGINEALGTDIQPKHQDFRPGDIRHSLADISRAGDELRYQVAVPFVEGLKRTVAHYQQHQKELAVV